MNKPLHIASEQSDVDSIGIGVGTFLRRHALSSPQLSVWFWSYVMLCVAYWERGSSHEAGWLVFQFALTCMSFIHLVNASPRPLGAKGSGMVWTVAIFLSALQTTLAIGYRDMLLSDQSWIRQLSEMECTRILISLFPLAIYTALRSHSSGESRSRSHRFRLALRWIVVFGIPVFGLVATWDIATAFSEAIPLPLLLPVGSFAVLLSLVIGFPWWLDRSLPSSRLVLELPESVGSLVQRDSFSAIRIVDTGMKLTFAFANKSIFSEGTIFVSDRLVSQLPGKELVALLLHEQAHIVLKHLQRRAQGLVVAGAALISLASVCFLNGDGSLFHAFVGCFSFACALAGLCVAASQLAHAMEYEADTWACRSQALATDQLAMGIQLESALKRLTNSSTNKASWGHPSTADRIRSIRRIIPMPQQQCNKPDC